MKTTQNLTRLEQAAQTLVSEYQTDQFVGRTIATGPY